MTLLSVRLLWYGICSYGSWITATDLVFHLWEQEIVTKTQINAIRRFVTRIYFVAQNFLQESLSRNIFKKVIKLYFIFLTENNPTNINSLPVIFSFKSRSDLIRVNVLSVSCIHLCDHDPESWKYSVPPFIPNNFRTSFTWIGSNESVWKVLVLVLDRNILNQIICDFFIWRISWITKNCCSCNGCTISHLPKYLKKNYTNLLRPGRCFIKKKFFNFRILLQKILSSILSSYHHDVPGKQNPTKQQ